MSFINNNLGMATGVALGSMITGAAVGYFLAKRSYGITVSDYTHKSYSTPNEVIDYIKDCSLQEPEVLTELRKHTFANVEDSLMLTEEMESQFFRCLLKVMGAKKCIEVGTFTGYNALSAALALPEDGKVYALDISEKFVNNGRQFFEKAGVSHKIDVRIAPAIDTLNQLIQEGQAGTFDFVYIDADKTSYDSYYEAGLQLLRKGGIIAVDNALFFGMAVNPSMAKGQYNQECGEAIKKLNFKIKSDPRVEQCFLGIADGVHLCVKL